MEEQKPIGVGLAFALIALALIVDGLQILLTLLFIGFLINPLIDILVGIAFTLMLGTHGGGLVRRRAIAMIMTAVGEFIPGINALPLWTAFAIYTIFMDRAKHVISDHSPVPSRSRSRGWRL